MQQPDRKEQITVQWAQSQPLIAAFISSLVPDFHDADDILQNVAIVTVRKYEQFDPNCSFVAWAIGIAKNEILKHQSKQGNRGLLDIGAVGHPSYEQTRFSENVGICGDCTRTFDDPAFCKLLLWAITWAAGENPLLFGEFSSKVKT
jgi:DNA-directed RNA polymerase specialized sigma24 family protein